MIFSVGARGWGEALTSAYLDANKVGGNPGVQLLRKSALETWTEPAVVPVAPVPTGPCPQADLLSLRVDDAHLTERLPTHTWTPSLREVGSGEAGMRVKHVSTAIRGHRRWFRAHGVIYADRNPGGG